MMGVSRETEVSKLDRIVNGMYETTKPPGNDYETISDLKRNNRTGNVQPEFPAQRTKADEPDYERLKKKAPVETRRRAAAGRGTGAVCITLSVIINILLAGVLGYFIWRVIVQDQEISRLNNRCTDCAHKDPKTISNKTSPQPGVMQESSTPLSKASSTTSSTTTTTATTKTTPTTTTPTTTTTTRAAPTTTKATTTKTTTPTTTIPTSTTTYKTTTSLYPFGRYDGPPHVTLSDAQLNRPQGVAVHPQTSDIYVTSYLSHKLCRFNGQSGSLISCRNQWNMSSGTTITLLYPRGVTIAPDGRIVVTDNHRVIVIDDDVVTRVWGDMGNFGSNLGQFHYPYQTAIDPAGKIYVPDYTNKRVQILDTKSDSVTLLGETVVSNSTSAAAINPTTGEILILLYSRILIFTESGEYKRSQGLTFWAKSICFGPHGYAYVTDQTNKAVHVFHSTRWSSVQSLGRVGDVCAGCFGNPNSVAVDKNNGNLVVSDYAKNRVLVFKIGGA